MHDSMLKRSGAHDTVTEKHIFIIDVHKQQVPYQLVVCYPNL